MLLKRAQRGDARAVDALLRLHYDSVHAVCSRIIINKSDAEDAVQMALISIVRALPSFDGRSKFSTWVYRIATNAALDELRRISRRALPTGNDTVIDSAVADATSSVDAQMDVTAALAQLPEDFRTVIVLRHIAELEYDEIALVIDAPVGTVRSRLSRARAQLQELLGNQSDGAQRQNMQQGDAP